MISTTLDRNQIRDRLVKGVDKKGKVVSNGTLMLLLLLVGFYQQLKILLTLPRLTLK